MGQHIGGGWEAVMGKIPHLDTVLLTPSLSVHFTVLTAVARNSAQVYIYNGLSIYYTIECPDYNVKCIAPSLGP